MRHKALRLYDKGMRLRTIYRVLGVEYYKVSGWVQHKYGNFDNRRWSKANKAKLYKLIR